MGADILRSDARTAHARKGEGHVKRTRKTENLGCAIVRIIHALPAYYGKKFRFASL